MRPGGSLPGREGIVGPRLLRILERHGVSGMGFYSFFDRLGPDDEFHRRTSCASAMMVII